MSYSQEFFKKKKYKKRRKVLVSIKKMNQEKKPTIHISVMFPDLTKMKQIRKELPNKSVKSFVRKYGKILDLLSENVKIDAITALIQFYDVPLRCFTFQ